MPAYNFQARFVPMIEAGRKRQTIRAPRARGDHVKPDQRFNLFTGMRTKACRKIGSATCTKVTPIFIRADWIRLGPEDDPDAQILMGIELEWFAQLDGFPNWEEFFGFFAGSDRRGIPWFGYVITWRDFETATARST